MSLTYCSYIFSHHLFSISLFLFLLHSLASFVSFTVTVPLSPNLLSNTSSEFLTYQLKLFSSPPTQASQLISSLPSLFLDRSIFAVSLLGCSSYLLSSPSWSSRRFFVYLITPPYRNKVTVYMFTALILLPPFNLEFIINFSVRRYSYLRASFISISFTLSIRFHHSQMVVPLFTLFVYCLTIHMSNTLSFTQLPIIHYCHPALL